MVLADESEIDWNGNGLIDADPVAQDVGRLNPRLAWSTAEVHVCATDWDKIWYHLSGDGQFDDSMVRPDGGIPDEPLRDELIELGTLEVVDLTGLGCVADVTTTGATIPGFEGYGEPDGVADLDDLGYYLNFWLVSDQIADLTTTGAAIPGFEGFGEPDGVVDLDDLGFFLNAWLVGCG